MILSLGYYAVSLFRRAAVIETFHNDVTDFLEQSVRLGGFAVVLALLAV